MMGKKNKPTETVSWAKSKAREWLIADLRAGVVPLDRKAVKAKAIHQSRPEYSSYEYQYFRGKLCALRHMVADERNDIAFDVRALANHRRVCPPTPDNHRGEPHWVGSAAEVLLKQDLDAGLHMTMRPSKLHDSREEYKVYPLAVFRKRIDQTLQSKKFLAYLVSKRTKAS
jgi:hypothetical protein